MDGTSYANVKATVEALIGSWTDGQWSLSWAPKGVGFYELGLHIKGPDEEGEVRTVTNVYDIPASILERVVLLRQAFEGWKSGDAYVFRLPFELRQTPEPTPEPAPSLSPEEFGKLVKTNKPLSSVDAHGPDDTAF
jgi:hypothetical protein